MNILIMNRKYDGIFGGVEHMITLIVNHLTQVGYNCHIVSLDKDDAKMMYDIDPKIKWHKIAKEDALVKASWKERLQRLQKIRNIIKKEKIDVAIGFQDGAFLSLALSAIGLNIPVIAAERNAPSRFNFLKEGRFRYLRFQSFRLASVITVQCPSYVNEYPEYLRDKIKVIPNPVFIAKKSQVRSKTKKNILSIGRLTYQKNYQVLIQAFAAISQEFPDWELILVGDGEDKEELKGLTQRFKINEKVIFAGYQKDPSQFLSQADIFCLPSRWEGFPNALVEAMALGVPAVGFSGCSGVSDLITHNKNGVLALGNEDPQTLSSALKSLMNNKDRRIEMGSIAKESVAEYCPAKIFKMWEELLKAHENTICH